MVGQYLSMILFKLHLIQYLCYVERSSYCIYVGSILFRIKSRLCTFSTLCTLLILRISLRGPTNFTLSPIIFTYVLQNEINVKICIMNVFNHTVSIHYSPNTLFSFLIFLFQLQRSVVIFVGSSITK